MNTQHLMQRAILLAEKGRCLAHPNPLVGALVVKSGTAIASGYHKEFGGPHAEVAALRAAGKRARGATLIVTLEPCSTFGKTPPCTELIIRSGVTRVIVGSIDPNPRHRGRGIRVLRKHGIAVTTGVCAQAVVEQNEVFFHVMKKKRPFIMLKLAMSLDGNIATRTGDSQWISSPASRKRVHELRAQADAVMVGAHTCVHDNAQLSVRGITGRWKEPFKVVLDPRLQVTPALKIVRNNDPQRVIIMTGQRNNPSARKRLEKKGVTVMSVPSHRGMLSLDAVFNGLQARGIASVLVEGGSRLAGSLFDAQLIDKVYFFYAPRIIGGTAAIRSVGGSGISRVCVSARIKNTSWQPVGPDMLMTGYPAYNEKGKRG